MTAPLRSLRVTLAAASLLGAHIALGFGHGESPGLSHFVRGERTVHASIVRNADMPAGYLGRWTVPGDASLVVTMARPAKALQSKAVSWKPGRVLAVYEGHASIDSASLLSNARATTLFLGGGLSLVSIDVEGWKSIVRVPHAFLDAVPNEETIAIDASGIVAPARSGNAERVLSTFTADSARLIKTVRELSGEDDVVIDGKSQRIPDRGNEAPRALAQKYMLDRWAEIGLEAELKCYDARWNKGCNVEATLWGQDRGEVVIFSAHLDSVRNKGADDDGSGTAALLEIARLFKAANPKRSVRFVSFDQEELGLVGSKAYADALPASGGPRIAGVFQMDMIAYDSDGDGAIHAMDCQRADSVPLTKAVRDSLGELRLGLKVVDACTNRSDHASFWNRGIPATIVSENFFGDRASKADSNKCYHARCDDVTLVNLPYMTNIVTLVANAGWKLVAR